MRYPTDIEIEKTKFSNFCLSHGLQEDPSGPLTFRSEKKNSVMPYYSSLNTDFLDISCVGILFNADNALAFAAVEEYIEYPDIEGTIPAAQDNRRIWISDDFVCITYGPTNIMDLSDTGGVISKSIEPYLEKALKESDSAEEFVYSVFKSTQESVRYSGDANPSKLLLFSKRNGFWKQIDARFNLSELKMSLVIQPETGFVVKGHEILKEYMFVNDSQLREADDEEFKRILKNRIERFKINNPRDMNNFNNDFLVERYPKE